MKKVKVQVSMSERNFAAVATFGEFPGAVVVTRARFEELKEAVAESVREHIAVCVADGDSVPPYLAEGRYELEWDLDTPSLLRSVEPFTSLAALSRASGINQHQLSHYATGLKRPRPQQRERIVAGLHSIGRNLLAVV